VARDLVPAEHAAVAALVEGEQDGLTLGALGGSKVCCRESKESSTGCKNPKVREAEVWDLQTLWRLRSSHEMSSPSFRRSIQCSTGSNIRSRHVTLLWQ